MISVILKSFIQIKKGDQINLFKSYKNQYKDGEQKRDFIYVKDCVRALLWFLENNNISGLFNLGSGNSNTFNELVNNVYKNLKKNVNVKYIEMPDKIKKQYQYETQADLKKLRSVGYKNDFYSLEEGIKDYIKILENSDAFS